MSNLRDQARKLPQAPGVYKFFASDGALLYVGKSKNIRTRVLSHIRNGNLNGRNVDIVREIDSIETIETAGELGALLLELWLIKKEMPLYNRMLRKTHLLCVVFEILDESGLRGVEIKRVPYLDPSEASRVLGVFRSMRKAKAFLEYSAKECELCPKLLGLEKSAGACFQRALGKCRGACIGKESVDTYNARFADAFRETRIYAWPFEKELVVSEARDGQTEEFTINQWCISEAWKGKKKEREPFFGEAISSFFDYDVYKVLFAYLKSI